MTSHFDFYSALGLDSAADSQQLTEVLNQRLAELQQQGAPATSGEVQVAMTARAILSDPQKRQAYDQRLADESAPTMDAAVLRNLAQTGSFEPATQFDAFQYQPTPTSAPAPVAQVTRTPLPELPANASFGALWNRIKGLPRFFTIAQGIAGLIPLLTFVYIIFNTLTLFGDSSSGTGSLDEMLGAFGRGIGLVVFPFIALILIPIFSMQLFWAWSALYANKPNYLVGFLVPQVSIALVAMLMMLTAGYMETYFMLFWYFLWFAATVTAIVLACLPAVRAWFNNEVLTVQQAQPFN